MEKQEISAFKLASNSQSYSFPFSLIFWVGQLRKIALGIPTGPLIWARRVKKKNSCLFLKSVGLGVGLVHWNDKSGFVFFKLLDVDCSVWFSWNFFQVA